MPYAIHHAFAFGDEGKVEVSDRHAFTLGNGWAEMGSFGTNNGGMATPTQYVLEFFISGNLPNLFW